MTDDNTIGLSRRRVLGGLGAIGVASAGAGIGTTAYFSDQEQFDDNTITAGEFGLTVKQAVTEVDQDGIGPDELTFNSNVEESEYGVWATDTITIEDAKPGDKYEFCWKLKVHDNPGYVAVAGDHTDENGVDAGNVSVDDLWDIDEEGELSTLGDEVLVDSLKITNGKKEVGYEYGEYYDTLGELLEDLEDGVLLHTDDGDVPITFEPGKKWFLCVKLSIPTDVGNEIQGASLEWNKSFYAEQARHNDDTDAFVGRAVGAHGD
ncbi:SipW-dependent-type signal peptide-containing protein [Natronobeatus ordinarius]|uniref:SipW-dependent-type signal peptide-containing protein n=1 Tax=Natronobeatus ordinarius TaxID=2963433 RepID=UPI0020CC8C4D|nr:SipW-dependent-type signal peptide-containing protein [Natronobeatus ordinarius]